MLLQCLHMLMLLCCGLIHSSADSVIIVSNNWLITWLIAVQLLTNIFNTSLYLKNHTQNRRNCERYNHDPFEFTHPNQSPRHTSNIFPLIRTSARTRLSAFYWMESRKEGGKRNGRMFWQFKSAHQLPSGHLNAHPPPQTNSDTTSNT